jgi:hypothetical protein
MERKVFIERPVTTYRVGVRVNLASIPHHRVVGDCFKGNTDQAAITHFQSDGRIHLNKSLLCLHYQNIRKSFIARQLKIRLEML